MCGRDGSPGGQKQHVHCARPTGGVRCILSCLLAEPKIGEVYGQGYRAHQEQAESHQD